MKWNAIKFNTEMKTSYRSDEVGRSIIFVGEKEDLQDRMPTSSSVQMTKQEELMPLKRKKKLAIFQAKKTIVSMAQQLTCGDARVENGDRMVTERNENQRFIQKQAEEYCLSPDERKPETKAGRRNKIFSKGFEANRSKIYGQSKENCLDADSTKRVIRRRSNEVYSSSIEMKQVKPIKQASSIHRLPLSLFRSQQFARLPTLQQQISNNLDSELATSHIQQVFLSQAESPQRLEYQMPHYNPISKKIKQIHHTKRRSITKLQPFRSSFDKIFRTNPIAKPPLRFRYDEPYYSNSVGSRLSLNNTNLKQNIIGHSLAACNIKQVDSSPSSECEEANQRYFDQQDQRKAYPFAHKISYRNIQIQEGADGIEEEAETRHHNLFSDFQCSRKKERRSITNSPTAEDRKNTKELFALYTEKPASRNGRFHLALVLLALLMLFIQVIG